MTGGRPVTEVDRGPLLIGTTGVLDNPYSMTIA